MGAVIFVTILTVKSTVLLPAGIASAAIEAGLPESSAATLVTGLLTGNETLTALTPGLTPAILKAAGTGELVACKWTALCLTYASGLTSSSFQTQSHVRDRSLCVRSTKSDVNCSHCHSPLWLVRFAGPPSRACGLTNAFLLGTPPVCFT